MSIPTFLETSKIILSDASYATYKFSINFARNTVLYIDRRTYNYRNATGNYLNQKYDKFNVFITTNLKKVDNKILELCHKVDNFFYQNYQNIIFPLLSFYLFKNAFNRVIIATIITSYIKSKNKSQISNPIINNTRFALTVIGTLGLYMHLKLYPLSNAVLFNSPILSGYAIGSVLYDLYMSYIAKKA
jgi:hypothetical protein